MCTFETFKLKIENFIAPIMSYLKGHKQITIKIDEDYC
jgi:hypothetical protein